MDRVGDEENAEPEATQEQAIQVMDMEIPRQPRPEPSDGEVRSNAYEAGECFALTFCPDVPDEGPRLHVHPA